MMRKTREYFRPLVNRSGDVWPSRIRGNNLISATCTGSDPNACKNCKYANTALTFGKTCGECKNANRA